MSGMAVNLWRPRVYDEVWIHRSRKCVAVVRWHRGVHEEGRRAAGGDG